LEPALTAVPLFPFLLTVSRKLLAARSFRPDFLVG
ncbi:MAG: hypothetical protein RJA41_862, partial [Actinomycetota bacterium]